MYEGNQILADEEEKGKRRELLEGRLIGKHLPRQKGEVCHFSWLALLRLRAVKVRERERENFYRREDIVLS